MTSLGEAQDATINSRNHAGGFIGPFIGMYASSNGQKSGNKASFDYFEYKEGAAFPLQVRKHSLHEIAVRDPYIFRMKRRGPIICIVLPGRKQTARMESMA